MWPNSRISDEEINRFLDGELSPSQRLDLQARLAQEPQRAAEVFAHAQRMEALRSAQPRRAEAALALLLALLPQRLRRPLRESRSVVTAFG